MKELDKNYNNAAVEDRIYEGWLSAGYFGAPLDSPKEPYTIIMPPPNITGELHMGHAYGDTIQDILIRMKRMQGYNALWLPGIDHASISTEVKVVDRMLREEGCTKADVGREGFLERAWAWKEQYGGHILTQIRKFGCSCDWERECFTMDEGPNKAVTEVFVRLYEKGLIYKGERLINWCPHCRTTISDAEVEHRDNEAILYYVRYPINESEAHITFATTRPETLFADVAIAVHPDDERYKDIVGKTVTIPFVNRTIPIIADAAVDMDFGMGALKITPGHSFADYEIGQRHNLPLINVLNDDGSLNHNNASFSGLDRMEARKRIMEEYHSLGLLARQEPTSNSIGVHERCKVVVEPLSKLQWFVKMEGLAAPAIDAYNKGELRIYPERFGKTYLHWLENIRDWCISRQLWWGHRIPAYTCTSCEAMQVARERPGGCACGHDRFTQDEDCLDTWFSSALWPFSTLGWPEDTPELRKFYPGDVLVTGHEIIFFWVIRMVFSGLEHMGSLPFRDVVLHGILRDEQGRKLSKSLGNGVDPLEVIRQFGADAMRMTLVAGNSLENDARFYPEKIEANRTLLNKIWNGARFILMNTGGQACQAPSGGLASEDRWIISRLNTLVQEVTAQLERYDFSNAIKGVIDFIWNEFCDWYIELVKPRLYNKEDPTREAALHTLRGVFMEAMKLLHPFMPFITEEVYQALRGDTEAPSIMIAAWPTYDAGLEDAAAHREVDLFQEAVRQVRQLRLAHDVEPGHKLAISIVAGESESRIFEGYRTQLMSLAGASSITINPGDIRDTVSVVIPGAVIHVPAADLVDEEKERARKDAQRTKLLGELSRVETILANPNFLKNAKPEVVQAERDKLVKYSDMLAKL